MEPERDGTILKRIFSAEREADRIVRDAEAQAAALLETAGKEAAGIVADRRRELASAREASLEAAVREAGIEAGRFVAAAQASTAAWVARESVRIDALADRLLEAVLPP